MQGRRLLRHAGPLKGGASFTMRSLRPMSGVIVLTRPLAEERQRMAKARTWWGLRSRPSCGTNDLAGNKAAKNSPLGTALGTETLPRVPPGERRVCLAPGEAAIRRARTGGAFTPDVGELPPLSESQLSQAKHNKPLSSHVITAISVVGTQLAVRRL